MASLSRGSVHIDPALLQQQLMESLRQKHWLVGDNKFLMEFISGFMTGTVHKLR